MTIFFICLVLTAIIIFATIRTIRSKGRLLDWIVAGFIIVILAAIAIPNYLSMDYGRVESHTKMNMHHLQLALDDFAKRTGGIYPINLGITVKEILNASSKKSNDSISIAGVNRDTIFTQNIGSAGASILTAQYRNFYKCKSNPVIIVSHADPPIWHKKCIGTVYYVPLEVKGNIAGNYKMYGADEKGLLSVILQPEKINQPNK